MLTHDINQAFACDRFVTCIPYRQVTNPAWAVATKSSIYGVFEYRLLLMSHVAQCRMLLHRDMTFSVSYITLGRLKTTP